MSSSSLASGASDVTSNVSTSREPLLHLNIPNHTFDKCAKCTNQFDFIKRLSVSKVPLILPCKHTLCEDCIRRMCIAMCRTICPICREEYAVPRSQIESIATIFQPHYAVIGYLVYTKNSPVKRDMQWVSSGYTLRSRHGGSGVSECDTDDKSDDESGEDGETPASLLFDKCPEHNVQYLNVNCDDCGNIYCCYCIIENHAGHKTTSLYKLSDEEKAELDKLRMEVEVILGQLLMSKRKVKELKIFESSNVEHEIKNYFSTLHASLHLAERNIRKRLTSMESEEADVSGFNAIIKSGIKRVKNVINNFNLMDSGQLNRKALLEEAQEVKELPCRLVSDQGSLRPIEFVSSDIFDDIEDQVCVTSMSRLEYNLLRVEDWTGAQEKYELEQIRRQIESPSPEERNIPTPVMAKTAKHSQNQAKKSHEERIRIVVTHINNVKSFFVQQHSSLSTLKDINNHIARRVRRKGIRQEEFKIGGTYGVAYEMRTSVHWRRGRILNCSNKDGQVLYKIFFMDYGNTQIVTREKLKEIDLTTVKRKPFAYECSLANPGDDAFDENAHLRLPQIIGQKELFVSGLRTGDRDSIQEVELFVAASNGGVVSVRDLLLNVPSTIPETKESLFLPTLKLFTNSKQFTVGQEVNVLVVFVAHPDYICVQLAQNVQFLRKMQENMDTYYKDSPLLNCIPVVGTDVVVRYDHARGNWHRGRITAVDVAAKEVDVHFVDWGKNVTVSWSQLRLLTENFIKAECQGIIVGLADLKKINESWSAEAVTFLRHQISTNPECKMVVSGVQPLEVALFQIGPSANVCLNSLMVEQQYAMTTGELSKTTLWPNVTDPPVEEDTDLTFQIVQKSEEVTIADHEDVHFKSGARAQVSFMDFQNPDLIYVKFSKLKDKEQRMHEELQIHYSAKTSKTKTSWKPNERCVVFDRIHHKYFRAVIKSTSDKDNYTAYLFDQMRELKVNKRNIFVREPYFFKYGTYVHKCKLSGIRPAGDAGTWSQLAIELLEKIFAMHKTIYIKKVEIAPPAYTFGVIMWYCKTTPGKALEPSQVKFVSINQILIESGVAFTSALIKSEIQPKVSRESKQNWYDLLCEDEQLDAETKEEYDTEIKEEHDPDIKESDPEPNGEEYQPTYQEGWLKSLKVQNREFNATLICVDINGFFYIRDEDLESCYVELEETLTSKFSCMQIPPEDTKWEVNDMCTLTEGGKWYRGSVLAVESNDEICVEMIDFGSAHQVSKKDITRRLMFADIPPFVYKVRLFDVYSECNAWSAADVEKVLEIVSDRVKIVIKNDLTIDVPFAEIYLDNGSNLNNLITMKLPHMSRRETKVVLREIDYDDYDDAIEAGIFIKQETPQIRDEIEAKEQKLEDIDDEGLLQAGEEDFDDYTYDCLPKSHEKKQLFVVSVLKWDKVYKVVLSGRESLETLDEFATLRDELQERTPSQPVLAKFKVNTPCVCLRPEKKVWARAVVYDVKSLQCGFVLAFFVDYGTVEMVPVGNVKEMRSDWFYLPVFMQIASIDIELLIGEKAEMVLTQLTYLRGKKVVAQLTSKKPVKVHLYDEQGDLCYQHFVVSGIVEAL